MFKLLGEYKKFREYKKYRENERYCYCAASYSKTLDFVDFFLSDLNKEDSQTFLKYVLEVIGRDLETSVQAMHIYKEETYLTGKPFPVSYYSDIYKSTYLEDEKNTVSVDLSKNIVIAEPWDLHLRLMPNLNNIKENEFVYNKDNHYSVFYPYMNICVVWNGHHSISSGKYFKKGVIRAAVYDSKTAFKKIDTDGKKWFDIGGFKPPEYSEEKVKDFRYALLFKIAKLLFESENE